MVCRFKHKESGQILIEALGFISITVLVGALALQNYNGLKKERKKYEFRKVEKNDSKRTQLGR